MCIGTLSEAIIAHELTHIFFGLKDRYYQNACYEQCSMMSESVYQTPCLSDVDKLSIARQVCRQGIQEKDTNARTTSENSVTTVTEGCKDGASKIVCIIRGKKTESPCYKIPKGDAGVASCVHKCNKCEQSYIDQESVEIGSFSNCQDCSVPVPTSTPTREMTETSIVDATFTLTSTSTFTKTSTKTPTKVVVTTPTFTSTFTKTSTKTPTKVVVATPTSTPTFTRTSTKTPTKVVVNTVTQAITEPIPFQGTSTIAQTSPCGKCDFHQICKKIISGARANENSCFETANAGVNKYNESEYKCVDVGFVPCRAYLGEGNDSDGKLYKDYECPAMFTQNVPLSCCDYSTENANSPCLYNLTPKNNTDGQEYWVLMSEQGGVDIKNMKFIVKPLHKDPTIIPTSPCGKKCNKWEECKKIIAGCRSNDKSCFDPADLGINKYDGKEYRCVHMGLTICRSYWGQGGGGGWVSEKYRDYVCPNRVYNAPLSCCDYSANNFKTPCMYTNEKNIYPGIGVSYYAASEDLKIFEQKIWTKDGAVY